MAICPNQPSSQPNIRAIVAPQSCEIIRFTDQTTIRLIQPSFYKEADHLSFQSPIYWTNFFVQKSTCSPIRSHMHRSNYSIVIETFTQTSINLPALIRKSIHPFTQLCIDPSWLRSSHHLKHPAELLTQQLSLLIGCSITHQPLFWTSFHPLHHLAINLLKYASHFNDQTNAVSQKHQMTISLP